MKVTREKIDYFICLIPVIYFSSEIIFYAFSKNLMAMRAFKFLCFFAMFSCFLVVFNELGKLRNKNIDKNVILLTIKCCSIFILLFYFIGDEIIKKYLYNQPPPYFTKTSLVFITLFSIYAFLDMFIALCPLKRETTKSSVAEPNEELIDEYQVEIDRLKAENEHLRVNQAQDFPSNEPSPTVSSKSSESKDQMIAIMAGELAKRQNNLRKGTGAINKAELARFLCSSEINTLFKDPKSDETFRQILKPLQLNSNE